MTKIIKLAGSAIAGLAILALAPTVASAAPAGEAPAGTTAVQSGWLGQCYGNYGGNWGGGWCDGNGPDWNYQGYVNCTNGWTYYGPSRWAGDQRMSYGTCPSGSSATSGGVYAFYTG
ncbi:hypothetical protein [Actinokineospora sp. HUAS TT18]|uniref:hypothetical protein n=1 Tax=Actinokineospora sp. HUAS TT18 TaxID=3447451 RepID=UPI003F522103